MRRPSLLTMALGAGLLVILPALAAPPATAPPPAADPGRTTASVPGPDKISITGDHFVIDDQQHQAVFTGNVETVQKELSVRSDKVLAFYGSGGAGNISSFEASGHVRLRTADQTATGDKAVFDPKTHLLTLTGNVIVTNKTGRVESSSLVVDLRTRKSVFSAKGGRVTGVFNSE